MDINIAGKTREEIDDEFTKKEIIAFLEANGTDVVGKPNKHDLVTMLYQHFNIDEEANELLGEEVNDDSDVEESDEEQPEDQEPEEGEGGEDEEGDTEGDEENTKGSPMEASFLSPEEAAKRINQKRLDDIARMKKAAEED